MTAPPKSSVQTSKTRLYSLSVNSQRNFSRRLSSKTTPSAMAIVHQPVRQPQKRSAAAIRSGGVFISQSGERLSGFAVFNLAKHILRESLCFEIILVLFSHHKNQ